MNESAAPNNGSCEVVLSSAAAITVSVLNSLCALLAVGGNTLVLLAIARTPTLQTTSNAFIASLAAADLIVGALANPLYISLSLMESLRDVRAIKNAETFVWLLTVTATTYNMCTVSIDRYIAVTTPLRYYQMITLRKCLYAIVLTWLFAIVFATSSFFVPLENIASLWITGSVLTVFVPFIIISFCYQKIWRVARLQANMIHAAEVSVATQENVQNRRKNSKAAWTFGIVILLFAVLFLPSLVTNFIAITAKTQCEFFEVNRLWFWTSVVSYSSSAVNPWIYAIRMREFRAAFKRVLSIQ